MTEDELTATVRDLKDGLSHLTSEWGQFLEMEAGRREEDVIERRKRDSSDSQKVAAEVANWEKGQTFLAKHGMKLAGVLFSIVSAGLAWYGSKIRGEIDAHQRSVEVDKGIRENTDNFNDFKVNTEKDIKSLQRESVNQTLMIDEGFKRFDKIMVKATALKEEDLPKFPEEFDEAVRSAKILKTHTEKFGGD